MTIILNRYGFLLRNYIIIFGFSSKTLDLPLRLRYCLTCIISLSTQFGMTTPCRLDCRRSTRTVRLGVMLRIILLIAAISAWPLVSWGYMPPPSPCELEPLTYGPAEPPSCPGPPPPKYCGPYGRPTCPPIVCGPRKLVGPPPCPSTLCKQPPFPTKAGVKVAAPCAAPPPSCGAPVCYPR